MCNRIPDPPDGILDVGEGRMRAAQAKWGRLSEHDLSGIRNKQDLIICVQRALQPTALAGDPGRRALGQRVRPTLGKGQEAPFAPIGRLYGRGLGGALGSKQVRYFSSRNLSFGSVTFFGLLASALA